MVYVAELDNLGDKEFETLKAAKENDIALVFSTQNAMIPVAKVMDFNSIGNKLTLIQTESSDVKAFHIGKVCATGSNDICMLTDIDVSDEIKQMFMKQAPKRTRSNKKASAKSVSKPRKEETVQKKPDASVPTDAVKHRAVRTQATEEIPASKKEDAKKEVEKIYNDDAQSDDNENLTYFIKQMSVRAKDMSEYDGTTEDLARKIVAILSGIEDVSSLGLVLQSNFSENDAKTVYKWIHPNIKRLMELAKKL